MALRLSWYMTASLNFNPWTLIKYLYHRNEGSFSPEPISSTSVEILEFIFCLLYMLATDTHPRDIVDPAWLRQSWCIAHDASTHHFTMFSLPNLNINGAKMVDMVYYGTYRSLHQSYLSEILTLVVRNATYVWIYLLIRRVANKSCATEWWNSVSWSSSNSLLSASSLTVNMCSDAGVSASVVYTSHTCQR